MNARARLWRCRSACPNGRGPPRDLDLGLLEDSADATELSERIIEALDADPDDDGFAFPVGPGSHSLATKLAGGSWWPAVDGRFALDFERARSRTVQDVTVIDERRDAGGRVDLAMCTLARLDPGADLDEPRFSIAEAAELTGLSAHTLRYYERVGLIDHVPRTAGGQRLYTPRALRRVVFLARMRSTGMPIDRLRAYVELIREGAHTSPGRRELLEAHRRDVVEQIATLRDALAVLDLKIDDYRIWEEHQ